MPSLLLEPLVEASGRRNWSFSGTSCLWPVWAGLPVMSWGTFLIENSTNYMGVISHSGFSLFALNFEQVSLRVCAMLKLEVTHLKL